MHGVDVIAEILKREGTEFLACYPYTPLIDACAKIDIRPIICRQERVGMGIADGFSRTTNGKRIGVFAMQHGPGSENAFPGAAQAFSDNVPDTAAARRRAGLEGLRKPELQRLRQLWQRHQVDGQVQPRRSASRY